MPFSLGLITPDLFLIGIPFLVLHYNNNKKFSEIPKELGFCRIAPLAFLKKTTAIIAILIALAFVISGIASIAGVNDLQAVEQAVNKIALEGTLVLGYLLTVRVFAEEVFFRGFLQKKIGIIPSTALFGLGHALFGSIIEVIGALALGYVLAWFMEKNQNIFPNIAGHLLYNFIALAVIV